MRSQVYKMGKNQRSKWEPNEIKYCNGNQANQNKVLNNYCHMTSVLMTSPLERHVISIASFFKYKLR